MLVNLSRKFSHGLGWVFVLRADKLPFFDPLGERPEGHTLITVWYAESLNGKARHICFQVFARLLLD